MHGFPQNKLLMILTTKLLTLMQNFIQRTKITFMLSLKLTKINSLYGEEQKEKIEKT